MKLIKTKHQKGFTLLEMLLSIALIALLSGLSIPVYQSFQVKNDLDIAANTIAQSTKRAQVLAQAVDGDTTWGIYIQSGSITIFQGSNYASRNTNYDEDFEMPTSITPSGLQEIVFSKLYGEPQAIGTVILTTSTNEIANLILNEKGMVSY